MDRTNPDTGSFLDVGQFPDVERKKLRTTARHLGRRGEKYSTPKDSNGQKIGDFYASCMDEIKIEAEGVKPLRPDLERIEKIRSLTDFQIQIARMHRLGVQALFFFGAQADLKNSSMEMGFLGQGGLSLPNRDYYMKTDERSQQLRAEFGKHVSRMFELLGDSSVRRGEGTRGNGD